MSVGMVKVRDSLMKKQAGMNSTVLSRPRKSSTKCKSVSGEFDLLRISKVNETVSPGNATVRSTLLTIVSSGEEGSTVMVAVEDVSPVSSEADVAVLFRSTIDE